MANASRAKTRDLVITHASLIGLQAPAQAITGQSDYSNLLHELVSRSKILFPVMTHWMVVMVRYTGIRMCTVGSNLNPHWLLRCPDSWQTTHDGSSPKRFRRFATVSTINLRLCITAASIRIHSRALRYNLRRNIPLDLHWIPARIMLQQPC